MTLQASSSAKLPRRGANAIGPVVGLPDADVYVPRAPWTESQGSPLKHKHINFDPQRFCDHEEESRTKKDTYKQYLVKEMDRTLQDTRQKRQTAAETYAKEVADIAAKDDTQVRRIAMREKAKEELKHKTAIWKAGVEDAKVVAARRAQETLAKEAKEAAEIKIRTTAQLCDDLARHARAKEAAKALSEEHTQTFGVKDERLREERQQDVERLSKIIRKEIAQEDVKIAAHRERLNLQQQQQSAIYEAYARTTAVERAAKVQEELFRQDRDAKVQELQKDEFYARRDAARQKQRSQMIDQLGLQVQARTGTHNFTQHLKDSDRLAVDVATMRAVEQDMEKVRAKRAKRAKLQEEVLVQIAERQIQRQAVGQKLCQSTRTMELPADQLSAILSKSQSLISLPAQPRSLEAPGSQPQVLGRKERAQFFNAQTGAMPIGSRLERQSRPTSLGPTKKEQAMHATWSEGLSTADLRRGFKVAQQRALAIAVDHSDV